MTIRQPQDPEVIRRIEMSLPPHLLNELDAATRGRKVHISLFRVIAIAIRRFLDEGGVESLPVGRPNVGPQRLARWESEGLS